MPVAQTIARQWPRVTPVPAYTIEQTLGQRRVRSHSRGPLAYRHRLARKRGLVDLERDRLDDASVGRNPLAVAHHEQITGHDLLRRDLALDAVAHDDWRTA